MVVAATAAPEQIGLPPFRDDFTSVEDLPVVDVGVISTEPRPKRGISEGTFLMALANEVEFHMGEVEDVERGQREMPEEQLSYHRSKAETYLSALAVSYPAGDEIIPINPDRPL